MKQAFTFFAIVFLCLTLIFVALIRNDPASVIERFKEEESRKTGSDIRSTLFPSQIDINLNINIQMDGNTAAVLQNFSWPSRKETTGPTPPVSENNKTVNNSKTVAPEPSSRHRHPNYLALFKSVNPKAEKTLTIAINQEPDSLDPLFQEMSASKEFYGHMFRQLTELDHEWKVFPELALEIPTLENGLWELLEDGRMRTTFNLRESKWSDGHPLTAEDFLFAYEVMMDEIQPVVSRDVYEKMEKMESKNEGRTLVITWKKIYAYAVEDDIYVLPKHALETIYRKDPVNYHTHPKVAREPVCNGPYRVKAWASGSHIILEKNPYWYGQEPHFTEIIYQFVKETSLLEDKIIHNEVQMISPIGMTMDQSLRLERTHGSEVNVFTITGLVWEHIDCNLDSTILKDKRVRQALMYGMNREYLVQTLFEGRQKVSHSWLPEQHYGFHPKVKQYAFDPEKAEALLESAGWKLKDLNGKEYSDEIRRNEAGEKLEIVFQTTTGNKVREEVQLILQSQWKKIGVDVAIKNQEAKLFFGETTNKRQFPHLAMYAWTMSPFSDGEVLWAIKNIPSEENSWKGQNYPGWKNERSNELDLKVSSILDREKRAELLRQEQELWVEDVPALPLYFRTDVMACHKKLMNVYITGTDTPVSWNSEYWGFSSN
ncbi:MAG: peptide ABC transporter substrate-binding protein [Planctomycetota bacterium]|mgnify:FL=1